MKRRQYLTFVGAITATSVSGCIASTIASSEDEQGMAYRIRMSEVVEQHEVETLTVEASITDPKAGDEAPAELTLTYRNTGEEPITLTGVDDERPDPLWSRGEPGGVILVPPKTYTDVTPVRRGCWTPQRAGFGQTLEVPATELPPDQQLQIAYEVWADPQSETECLQPGEYTFKENYISFGLTIET